MNIIKTTFIKLKKFRLLLHSNRDFHMIFNGVISHEFNKFIFSNNFLFHDIFISIAIALALAQLPNLQVATHHPTTNHIPSILRTKKKKERQKKSQRQKLQRWWKTCMGLYCLPDFPVHPCCEEQGNPISSSSTFVEYIFWKYGQMSVYVVCLSVHSFIHVFLSRFFFFFFLSSSSAIPILWIPSIKL